MQSVGDLPESLRVEKVEQVEQLSQVVVEWGAREENTMYAIELFETIEDEVRIGFDCRISFTF